MKPHGARRARARWLASLCAALMLPPCVLAQGGITVSDDRGVAVRFERPPQRVVSLLPSLTETVCELGQCHRLVGVDRDSNYPQAVRHLPRVGGGLDPNIEAIMALRPEVVLIASSSRAGERLQALGLKVLALEPRTHADVRQALLTIGRLLDVPDAERTWRAIEAGVSAAARSLPPAARGARVYFEASAGPYAAGEASFIGETLARLAAVNIVPREMGPFPRINPEYVVRADPDVVMVGERGAGSLGQRPGWTQLRAVREGRVCVFGPAQGDVLVRPGPRMAEAARLMADCLAASAPALRERRP